MSGDFPTFIDTAHTHAIYSMGNMITPTNTVSGTTGIGLAAMNQDWGRVAGNAVHRQEQQLFQQIPENPKANAKPKVDQMTRRIVQVFIADTDENVPLEKSVIYTGTQKLTDSTDQELYFEIDLKKILDEHNAYRITLINKKVKERTENLEPVKIRDLKMVVVTIASF